MCKETEVASAHTHTHTHMQNVLHVGTLINEVFGSLGPAAGLGKWVKRVTSRLQQVNPV